jgi:hypothetical protein
MTINPRSMRKLTVDGARWFWRAGGAWGLDQLVVLREDRRTMLWLRNGANPTLRVVRSPRDEREGLYVVPDLPALMEPGPGAAAALARWIESDAPKQRVAAAPIAQLDPLAKECRREGRYWFNPEGDEDAVRAVLEETLQRPIIAPFLADLERELGPRKTQQLASECLEALVARGVLDEPWLRRDARRVAVDAQPIRDDAPYGLRSLRALWALAKAPRAVLDAERLAREFEARYRAFVSDDRLGDGPAALSWLVVEHPRVSPMPVHDPSGAPMTVAPMHEWWAVTMQLASEEQRALVAWPESTRTLAAYRADASAQSPLLALAWQHTEELRAWRALCERGVEVRRDESVEQDGVHRRWLGQPARSIPAMCEPTAAIARAGFALWSAMPWRMVLVATVQP